MRGVRCSLAVPQLDHLPDLTAHSPSAIAPLRAGTPLPALPTTGGGGAARARAPMMSRVFQRSRQGWRARRRAGRRTVTRAANGLATSAAPRSPAEQPIDVPPRIDCLALITVLPAGTLRSGRLINIRFPWNREVHSSFFEKLVSVRIYGENTARG